MYIYIFITVDVEIDFLFPGTLRIMCKWNAKKQQKRQQQKTDRNKLFVRCYRLIEMFNVKYTIFDHKHIL